MANVIITGANQGIGYFFVEQLLKEGHRIAVLDLETENLAQLSEMYIDRLLYFKVDVRNPEDIKNAVSEAVKAFQTLDIVIHNACRCTFAREAATDLSTYRDVFDVNYFGALHLIKAALPYMSKQKHGKVVFTSSGVGVTGFIGLSPYASTKGALESLAKCLNLEYEKDHISFHIFHPPLTQTKSALPLPVPKEFMAKPGEVGTGFAKHLKSKHFVICNSLSQKIQIRMSYLFPVRTGKLLSKATARVAERSDERN